MRITHVDEARLKELGIAIIDTGRALLILQYHPEGTVVLYRKEH